MIVWLLFASIAFAQQCPHTTVTARLSTRGLKTNDVVKIMGERVLMDFAPGSSPLLRAIEVSAGGELVWDDAIDTEVNANYIVALSGTNFIVSFRRFFVLTRNKRGNDHNR
jgi:hypothetical protein